MKITIRYSKNQRCENTFFFNWKVALVNIVKNFSNPKVSSQKNRIFAAK